MLCFTGKVLSRNCGEEGHVPLKCSEVEKKGVLRITKHDPSFTFNSFSLLIFFLFSGQTDTRLAVEEAMTKARLRECKKCKAK